MPTVPSGKRRDALLVYNLTLFLAEKDVEDGVGPAAFAAAMAREPELLDEVTERLARLTDAGETYPLEIVEYDGDEPIIEGDDDFKN